MSAVGPLTNDDLQAILKASNDEQHLPTMQVSEIDEMVARKDDLEYQYGLCRRMMVDGLLLPYPFDRAVILLRKANRIEDEIEICKYVEKWAVQSEARHITGHAKIWLSPKIQGMKMRREKAEALLKRRG